MTGTTLTDRAILRISGEEARPFLQGLLTRDVLTLRADNPRWTGLLSPQGKALFDFILWGAGDEDQGNDVLIDCEASQADAGLSIELRRVEGLDPALLPDWLAAAIAGEAAV